VPRTPEGWEMLVVSGLAASVAYLIGHLLRGSAADPLRVRWVRLGAFGDDCADPGPVAARSRTWPERARGSGQGRATVGSAALMPGGGLVPARSRTRHMAVRLASGGGNLVGHHLGAGDTCTCAASAGVRTTWGGWTTVTE
jgi:hypothetical protein